MKIIKNEDSDRFLYYILYFLFYLTYKVYSLREAKDLKKNVLWLNFIEKNSWIGILNVNWKIHL